MSYVVRHVRSWQLDEVLKDGDLDLFIIVLISQNQDLAH